MFTDYTQKLRDLYHEIHGDDPKKPITEGFACYDWICALEDDYRKAKGFDIKTRIDHKDVYEFALKHRSKL